MIYILGFLSIILFGIIIVINYQLCIPIETFLKGKFPFFIGQREFWLNMFMGVFGSILVSLIVEIINYVNSKKNSILLFLQKAAEINTLYKNVTYAFKSIDPVEKEQELYKEILNYNMNDLYNAYCDIDFIIARNKYSVLLKDLYVSISDIKNKIELKRQKIFFSDDERFEERESETIQKFFFEMRKVHGENEYRQVFHSDTISDKIDMIYNLLLNDF